MERFNAQDFAAAYQDWMRKQMLEKTMARDYMMQQSPFKSPVWGGVQSGEYPGVGTTFQGGASAPAMGGQAFGQGFYRPDMFGGRPQFGAQGGFRGQF